jgi:hypothetical protein
MSSPSVVAGTLVQQAEDGTSHHFRAVPRSHDAENAARPSYRAPATRRIAATTLIDALTTLTDALTTLVDALPSFIVALTLVVEAVSRMKDAAATIVDALTTTGKAATEMMNAMTPLVDAAVRLSGDAARPPPARCRYARRATPAAEPRWNHKDCSARPVRSSAGLSPQPFASNSPSTSLRLRSGSCLGYGLDTSMGLRA